MIETTFVIWTLLVGLAKGGFYVLGSILIWNTATKQITGEKDPFPVANHSALLMTVLAGFVMILFAFAHLEKEVSIRTNHKIAELCTPDVGYQYLNKHGVLQCQPK